MAFELSVEIYKVFPVILVDETLFGDNVGRAAKVKIVLTPILKSSKINVPHV